MAIATTWLTTATNITSSAALYTTSSSAYIRDLVITNGGPSYAYVSVGTAATSAAAANAVGIAAGATMILTQGQVPVSTIIYGFSSGTASVSIGYGSNVSYA